MVNEVERLIPGEHYSYDVIQEHFNRYVFAGNYVDRKTALDIGCGSGYGAYYLSTRNSSSVKGIDLKNKAIKVATSNYSADNLIFEKQTIEEILKKKLYFDVVICFEIIEHLENPIDFIRDCIQILSKKGILLISTPNAEKNLKLKTKNPFHKHEFFQNEFTKLLKSFFNTVEFFCQHEPDTINEKTYQDTKMPVKIETSFLDSDFSVLSDVKKLSNFLLVCKKPKNLNELDLNVISRELNYLHNKEKAKTLTEIFENENNNPLGLLLNIYQSRNDLQNSFPEVKQGKYDNLIQWASNTCKGLTNDYIKEDLKKFSSWYIAKHETQKQKQEEIDKLDKSFWNLNTELKEYKELLFLSYSELEDYKKHLNISNNTIKDYKEQLDTSNNEIKDYEEQLDTSKNTIKAYKEQLDTSTNKIKAYKEQLYTSTNKIKTYKEQLYTSNNEIKDYKKQLDTLNTELKTYKEHLNISNKTIKAYKEQLNTSNTELENYKNELRLIRNSFIMRSLRKIDNAFPEGSKRNEIKKIFLKSMGIISKEGFGSYLSQSKSKIKRKEFHIVDPIFTPKYVSKHTHNSEQIIEECLNFDYKPKISVLMPTYETKIEWLDLAIKSLQSQYYDNWELCICDDNSKSKELKNRLNSYARNDKRIKFTNSKLNNGIAMSTNKAFSLATGEFVLFLDHDDELSVDALYEIVKALNDDNNLDFLYSDEDKIDENGNFVEPFFKPDFSIHLLRSLNYLVHVAVIRKKLIEEVGLLKKEYDGAQDYDLFFRVLEKTNKIYHIKEILYHWRKVLGSGAQNALAKDYIYERANLALQHHLERCGIDAKSEIGKGWGLYKVNYKIKETNPSVDILIPTRQISFLKKCIKSIKEKSTWKNYRIFTLVNGKTDYVVIEIKSKDCSELKSITDSKSGLIGPSLSYNWSRMNNIGVKSTNSPYIIFLNDDTEIISEDWIENMLQYAQLDEIGVVGVMLIYLDDSIQHAGDFITPKGTGDHCFNGMDPNSFEINGFSQVVRETSAVTSACYMMRRKVFENLNGYDEKLRNYDDYDFCLRLKEKNYSIIYTPYTRVYHHESPVRPQINDESMLKTMLQKHPWARNDSFYRYEWTSMYNRIKQSK